MTTIETTLGACSATAPRSKRIVHSWKDARRIARGHGFDSKEEFLEYSCPGAYQLPKNPQELYAQQWKGWDDWLGICWDFTQGRQHARRLRLKTREQYMRRVGNRNNHVRKGGEEDAGGGDGDNNDNDDDPIMRLPYQPDLKYGNEWTNWEDWLGV